MSDESLVAMRERMSFDIFRLDNYGHITMSGKNMQSLANGQCFMSMNLGEDELTKLMQQCERVLSRMEDKQVKKVKL